MAPASSRTNGPEASTIMMQSRAAAHGPPFEDDAGLLGFLAQPSNLSHYDSPEESLISPVQGYEQPFVLVDFDASKEPSWSIRSSSPGSSVYPWGSAYETISSLALLQGSGSSQQIDGDWDPPIQSDNISFTHQPHFPDLTTDGTSVTPQGVNMSNIIDLVYDTDIFLASPHPLPDGALSQGNKDPWSLSGCHPTSRPYLVIHCHPSHEGYDNSLCLEDCGADFGFNLS
jgi:hypothetical protein